MALRLIINADDFGITPGINCAIAELHRAGVLTSTTLMATGPAFDHAVAIARSLPTLGVGCHIVLVDGTPVLPPSHIPTLLGPDRRTFRPTLGAFVRDLLLGRIDPDEIAYESIAQKTKLKDVGIAITHIDTHKHLHIFPVVTQALLYIRAPHAIRNPFEPSFSSRLAAAPLPRRLQLALLNHFRQDFSRLTAQTRTTDGTLGIAATGTLETASLGRLLRALPQEGTYELCCHPGYNDADLDRVSTRLRSHREIERRALLREIPTVLASPHPPQLIHYGELTRVGVELR